MRKKIYIIGIGGRTGAMFCRELQGVCDITGVGLADEVAMVDGGKIRIQRGGFAPEVLRTKAVGAQDFSKEIIKNYPDFIWLATRNPINRIVEFYYGNFKNKEKVPSLIIAQNGLSAITDARAGLEAALGQEADKVKIIRASLINGVDIRIEDGTSVMIYKIPIKLGFGAITCQSDGLREILLASGIKIQEFQGEDVLKMENSKLFTNLIGMASAANGFSVSDGFKDKKVFQEEVAILREYVLAVKNSGGGFLNNYAGYPINLLAQMMLLPVELLIPFRVIFERIVTKGRNRPKDFSEIDYYNGEVVRLGARTGVPTPINDEIIRKVKVIHN